jgi:hypothetical protein
VKDGFYLLLLEDVPSACFHSWDKENVIHRVEREQLASAAFCLSGVRNFYLHLFLLLLFLN